MLSYTIVGDEDGSNIVVFVPGSPPAVAHSSHRNFAEIVARAKDGDDTVLALFDVAETVATEFDRISERVTAANGRLYFDGDEVDNSLADLVLRAMDDGEDFAPLLAFFENVQQNPNEHSRAMLFDWLGRFAFAITRAGEFVGYKGVEKLEDGTLQSVRAGRALVDDVLHVGNIPNGLGSVVSMPRSEVQHDPAVGCSVGLHVGTFEYASDWARGAVLEVHVNPRDVVSVPTDCGSAKLRTCRYRVAALLDAPYSAAIVPAYDAGDGEPDSWSDGEDW